MAIAPIRQPIDNQAFIVQPELPDKPESQSSLFPAIGISAIGMIGASLLHAKIATKICDVTSSHGLCLGNLISANGTEYLWKVADPLARLNNLVATTFGSNLTTELVIPACCEELEFRWFVQELVFQKIPQKIIEQISPEWAQQFDSKTAKILRVIAVSVIFALMHVHKLSCEHGGGTSQIFSGLLFGALYELSGQSLAVSAAVHCLFNLLI
jgi:hypothetical protein